jgi:hypothetical protein
MGELAKIKFAFQKSYSKKNSCNRNTWKEGEVIRPNPRALVEKKASEEHGCFREEEHRCFHMDSRGLAEL